MVLLSKRLGVLEEFNELTELGGVNKLFPKITKAELAVQASIFASMFEKKSKISFVGVCNAEAFLEICLRLARSKNNYFAEVAGRATGAIIREINQEFLASLTSCMPSLQKEQIVCVKIFRVLEEICKALKGYKRGMIELNEIDYLIERLKPKVELINLPPQEESFFFIK